MPEADLPYNATTNTELTEQAANDFKAGFEPPNERTAIRFNGTCPRCKHPMTFLYPLELFEIRGVKVQASLTKDLEDLLEARGISVKEIDVNFACACTMTHTKAPKDKPGCGAYWKLHLKWP